MLCVQLPQEPGTVPSHRAIHPYARMPSSPGLWGERRCQPPPFFHRGAEPHLCGHLGPAQNRSPCPPNTRSDGAPDAAQGHTYRTRKLAVAALRGALLWVPGAQPRTLGPPPWALPPQALLCPCLPPSWRGVGAVQGGQRAKPLGPPTPQPRGGGSGGGALPRGPLPLCTPQSTQRGASLPPTL